jgi:hypothetical protein
MKARVQDHVDKLSLEGFGNYVRMADYFHMP